jgi:uncharacterized protein YkwD
MPTIALNWVDVLSIILLVFSIIEGWRLGFIHLSASFAAYVIAFFVSMTYHKHVGLFLVTLFGIPKIWTDSIGYISLIAISLILFTQLFLLISERIVTHFINTFPDRATGVIISFVNACIILVFVFVAVTAVPDVLIIKEGVEKSKIAHEVLTIAQRFGGSSVTSLEQSIKDNVRFVTIDPLSGESLQLPFTLQRWNLMDDMEDASRMVTLINNERTKMHLNPLIPDNYLATIASSHSRDMFERKYFSHSSPEGKTMKDRLEAAHISFLSAAENLAFAPDITTAHEGLMNSALHKAAILDPSFLRVGVGVIDSGSSGIMVTELFVR